MRSLKIVLDMRGQHDRAINGDDVREAIVYEIEWAAASPRNELLPRRIP
jgi:hypothetical protein